jgi:hypothetical protein
MISVQVAWRHEQASKRWTPEETVAAGSAEVQRSLPGGATLVESVRDGEADHEHLKR